MFDFISLDLYTPIYYVALFIISLLIVIHAAAFDVRDKSSLQFFSLFGTIFMIVFCFYIGLRPISGKYFGDMGTYAHGYMLMQKGAEIKIEDDYLFNYFMLACSKFLPVKYFFLLVDILYILPCYCFSKVYFKNYWFFAFFMLIGSFSFWSYGTNGIRNGLATSTYLLGLCYYNRNRYWMYFIFGISFFMHSSILIPITAFVISGFYKNPKIYLYIWLAAIPLSLAGGSIWQNLFFNHLGFESRTTGYMQGDQVEGNFSSSGFRWDFLFYSTFGIAAGYYYIFIRKITDSFYMHLFGTYTISNAFWILVITANYSNRFAYLSWFLMAPVIAYPMFTYKIWKDQYRTFGWIAFVYYLFTFLMFLKN